MFDFQRISLYDRDLRRRRQIVPRHVISWECNYTNSGNPCHGTSLPYTWFQLCMSFQCLATLPRKQFCLSAIRWVSICFARLPLTRLGGECPDYLSRNFCRWHHVRAAAGHIIITNSYLLLSTSTHHLLHPHPARGTTLFPARVFLA